MRESTLSLNNTTRANIPLLPYSRIKDLVLGKKYSLSLVFTGNTLSKKLNTRYRQKSSATNILSFPLSKNEGEIFLNPLVIKKQRQLFNRSFRNLTAFLFIHGLFHLKGMRHGSTMEKKEAAVRKRFGV